MTKRISEAIDVFLDAINNGTLAKGTCTACAVGNLVAHGLNGRIQKKSNYYTSSVENECWSLLFMTDSDGQSYHDEYSNNKGVLANINATNFNVKELMAIEYAFETNTEIDYFDYNDYTEEEILKDQIKGLEAVVQVMMDFDDVRESIQEVFTNKVCLQ